jgi:zinc transport system permease protein
MIEVLLMPFMIRAYVVGALIGFLASYYGVFVVQRKMSFLGSGLAHAAFGGVALGLLLNTEPLVIAVPFTIIISLLISLLKEKTSLGTDTAIGILFSIAMALGIVFLALKKDFATDAFAYLFGSIIAVSTSDLYISLGLLVITLMTLFRHWSRWAYATFDTELAIADRLPVSKDNYLLSALIALSIVVSVKLVGIVLISAFLVLPSASARLISKTFFAMTVISIIFGVFSSIVGLILSVLLDIPSGATIILTQALLFFIALIISKR